MKSAKSIVMLFGMNYNTNIKYKNIDKIKKRGNGISQTPKYVEESEDIVWQTKKL